MKSHKQTRKEFLAFLSRNHINYELEREATTKKAKKRQRKAAKKK